MIKKVLENIGEELIEEIQNRMSQKNLNASGKASDSLKAEASDTLLEIKGNRYIGALNKGRKPGKFPPPDEILKWIKNKLNISDAEKLVYPISKKIAEKGTNIFMDNSLGIELNTIEEIGVKKIKKQVSFVILKDLKTKIHDLTKEIK